MATTHPHHSWPAFPDPVSLQPVRTAAVEKPAPLPGQSGRAREQGWVLRFPRAEPPRPDPLTGWTGGTDPLAHVELRFPTRAAAVRFATQQGYAVDVREPGPHRPVTGGLRTFQEQPVRPVGYRPGPIRRQPRPGPLLVARHPVAPDLTAPDVADGGPPACPVVMSPSKDHHAVRH